MDMEIDNEAMQMEYNIQDLIAELEDQKYEMYGTFVIDFDDVMKGVKRLIKELQEISEYEEKSNKPWITPMDLIKVILGE